MRDKALTFFLGRTWYNKLCYSMSQLVSKFQGNLAY